MFMTIKLDGQQPYAFNPVDAARSEPEFLVQMLERMLDEKFSTEKRADLLARECEIRGLDLAELIAALGDHVVYKSREIMKWFGY